jgi:hypothetical protein
MRLTRAFVVLITAFCPADIRDRYLTDGIETCIESGYLMTKLAVRVQYKSHRIAVEYFYHARSLAYYDLECEGFSSFSSSSSLSSRNNKKSKCRETGMNSVVCSIAIKFDINININITTTANYIPCTTLNTTAATAITTAHLTPAPVLPFAPNPTNHQTKPPLLLPSRSKSGLPSVMPLNFFSLASL